MTRACFYEEKKGTIPMRQSNQTRQTISFAAPVFAFALMCASGLAIAQQGNTLDLGGGTSMMKDMPFLQNLGATTVDIMFLAAKVIGGFLAFIGVKNIGQRDWRAAVPALVGGTLLFFLPQIITALQKMGGTA
jgi:hypothetical protein